MVSFNVSSIYVLDLRDDFLMNDSKKLYEFLDKDPVKAFHLGIHVTKWFDSLDKHQMYLHSKLLRHNQEDVEDYLKQIEYWTKKFSDNLKDEEVDMIDLSEFIFNNIIWNPDTEETDRVKLALFLGMVVGKNSDLSNEQSLYNIH